MANQTLKQIADVNTLSTLISNDLLYVSQSPYGIGDDAAIDGTGLFEYIVDVIASALVGGSNINVSFNDPANSITLSVTGLISTDISDFNEAAQDAVGTILDSSLTYNDSTPSIGIATSGVTETLIQDNAVTTAKIQDNAVTTAKIPNDAVTNAKLANVATATIKGRISSGTGDPEDLTPAQGRSVLSVKEQLTANRTYFVNASTGNDSNNGLSAGSPFLTIGAAVNAVAALEIAPFTVTINVAAGTYTSTVTLPAVTGSVTITGSTSSPSTRVINVSGNPCIRALDPNRNWTVEGFRLINNDRAIDANPGFVAIGDIEFNVSFIPIMARNGGVVDGAVRSFTVLSQPISFTQATQGTLLMRNSTITLNSTFSYSAGFIAIDSLSYAEFISASFSGSAAGRRYIVSTNSVINTSGGGANFFPGNSAGVSSTGGQYV